MAILDAATLAGLANRPDYADPGRYNQDYIAGVIDDAQSQIQQYLGYDPVLAAVAGEEGQVTYVSSGPYVGQYLVQLRHAPLIAGTAAQVLSSLTLTYGVAATAPQTIDVTNVTLVRDFGALYVPSFTPLGGVYWGDVSYLEADGWFYGRAGAPLLAGYVASYVGGYATGIGDPAPGGGGSYAAQPMPAAITQAAVLLCRERIALDDAANQQTTNASAGSITYLRTADQEVKYQSYSQSSATGQGGQLGSGTAMAQAALSRLRQYRRPVA